MIQPRCDRTPWARRLLGFRHEEDGPRWDRVKAERPALVCEPQRSIPSFFHLHVGSPNRVVNLIELSLIQDRQVVAHAAGRLEAQTLLKYTACRLRSMQVSGVCRRHGKSLVRARQIPLQKSIGLRESCVPRSPQLLDYAILEGLKEPL